MLRFKYIGYFSDEECKKLSYFVRKDEIIFYRNGATKRKLNAPKG